MKTLVIAFSFSLVMMSCNSKKNDAAAKDDKTAFKQTANEITDEVTFGFMLGGMYPAGGFGGVANTMQQVNSEITADKGTPIYLDEMQKSYLHTFSYPFDETPKAGTISMLKTMWEISDKTSLDKRLAELIDDKHSRAWDLARYANLINLATCAGIITKPEGNEFIKKIVPIAKKNYDNWDVYMKDYNVGRKKWSPEDKDELGYEKASTELLTTKNSIYEHLKL